MISEMRPQDAGFPKNLASLERPPEILYVNGELLPQDACAVALVGSRNATHYGIEVCEKLACQLASAGVTIVSGMARGIDTAAHRGALRAKGRTIAVLGSGHGHIYPQENIGLYGEISQNGAVVSEFPHDMKPLPYNFPRRNRIISGLALGVVVVEAAKNSGALISAEFAAEQGREVFAVPGMISSPTSSGTHALIRDGAKLVQTVEDILEELDHFKVQLETAHLKSVEASRENKAKAFASIALTEGEKVIYESLSCDPLYIDYIFSRCGIGIADGTKALVGLQMKRLAKELPGKKFVRAEGRE